MKAKNGISLIVLVITIVVIIILAAAVILSLGQNNPINDSKVAGLLNNKDNVQSAMVNAIGSRLAKNAETTSDTVELLKIDPAILDGDEMKAGTITGLYKINGWDELGIKQPSTDTWYYSVKDGRVYVAMSNPASYYTENATAASMILTPSEITAVATAGV